MKTDLAGSSTVARALSSTRAEAAAKMDTGLRRLSNGVSAYVTPVHTAF